MAGLLYDPLEGQLTIDGVDLRCPAWVVLDLVPLWMDFEVRGQDQAIPNARGIRANPRRFANTPHTLEIVVTGKADRLGVAPACTKLAELQQLEENLDYLRANVVDPNPVGDGTRTAVLTMPSGATRTGPVHVGPMPLARRLGHHSLVANLAIEVKRGVLD